MVMSMRSVVARLARNVLVGLLIVIFLATAIMIKMLPRMPMMKVMLKIITMLFCTQLPMLWPYL